MSCTEWTIGARFETLFIDPRNAMVHMFGEMALIRQSGAQVAPTRELALQIQREANTFCKANFCWISLWSLWKSSRMSAKIRRSIWLGVTVFILRQLIWQVFAPMVAGRWVSNCLPWRKDFVFSNQWRGHDEAWWGMTKHNPFRDNSGIL